MTRPVHLISGDLHPSLASLAIERARRSHEVFLACGSHGGVPGLTIAVPGGRREASGDAIRSIAASADGMILAWGSQALSSAALASVSVCGVLDGVTADRSDRRIRDLGVPILIGSTGMMAESPCGNIDVLPLAGRTTVNPSRTPRMVIVGWEHERTHMRSFVPLLARLHLLGQSFSIDICGVPEDRVETLVALRSMGLADVHIHPYGALDDLVGPGTTACFPTGCRPVAASAAIRVWSQGARVLLASAHSAAEWLRGEEDVVCDIDDQIDLAVNCCLSTPASMDRRTEVCSSWADQLDAWIDEKASTLSRQSAAAFL
ncbi:MAG: hypothetical protein MK100_02485 [Phycisphaerales bacterium]|nr:hypothetical protein [Phycisphaerales bacterium]